MLHGIMFLGESFRTRIKNATNWGRGENKCILSFGRENWIIEIDMGDTEDTSVISFFLLWFISILKLNTCK